MLIERAYQVGEQVGLAVWTEDEAGPYIIDAFEAVAKGWNQHPTPFEWGGKRAQRRQQARLRKRHRLGASGACTRYPIRRHLSLFEKWRCS